MITPEAMHKLTQFALALRKLQAAYTTTPPQAVTLNPKEIECLIYGIRLLQGPPDPPLYRDLDPDEAPE